MSSLRPYIYILAAVAILFSLLHGCADSQRSALFQQFTGSSTPTSESASPAPLSSEDKAHLKRLNAERAVERQAVQSFDKAMSDHADEIADHIKLIRSYLDEPHYDDSVWQGNIRSEAQAVEDAAQLAVAIKSPQQCRAAFRLYLAAMELDRSAAHMVPKALDTHHDDWIQNSLKKFDQANEKIESASTQVKTLDAELAVEKTELE